MHPRQCLPTVAVSLAAAQGQSISWAQLRRFGLSEKVIRRMSKEWGRLGRGVYCLTSPQWPSAAWAGLLVGGDSATVGGLAAAHLYGWSPTAPARITIWTDTRAAPWQIGEWRVIFRRGLRSARGQIRRTSPEETLLDVASECGADATLHLLARALTERHTTPERVIAELRARSRQRHRRDIAEACAHGMAGVESILEWRYLTQVQQAHGLPSATRQARLTGSSRCDVFYEPNGVIVELDGRLGHLEEFRDHRRDNRNAVEHGALTLRYGSQDLFHSPCAIASQVAQVLRLRGWTGSVTTCRTCRPGSTRR